MHTGSRLSKLMETIPELQAQPEWVTAERAPWLVAGKLDVERLFEHLLFPFLERCLRLGDREITVRLCTFLDKLVTNSQDELLVNQLRERASHVFAGIAPRVSYPRHPPLWVTDQPNVLDAASLEQVRTALERPTVVFGFQAYFYGGSGGDWWAVAHIEDYVRLVRSARPGDLFWVHAMDTLVQARYALAGIQVEPGQRLSSHLLGAEALNQIETHIRTGDSVVFVWWGQAASGDGRVCGIQELMEDFQEELDTELTQMDPAAGALYAFRFRDLEQPGCWLLKAKRPNEFGEVPIGGAY